MSPNFLLNPPQAEPSILCRSTAANCPLIRVTALVPCMPNTRKEPMHSPGHQIAVRFVCDPGPWRCRQRRKCCSSPWLGAAVSPIAGVVSVTLPLKQQMKSPLPAAMPPQWLPLCAGLPPAWHASGPKGISRCLMVVLSPEHLLLLTWHLPYHRLGVTSQGSCASSAESAAWGIRPVSLERAAPLYPVIC